MSTWWSEEGGSENFTNTQEQFFQTILANSAILTRLKTVFSQRLVEFRRERAAEFLRVGGWRLGVRSDVLNCSAA